MSSDVDPDCRDISAYSLCVPYSRFLEIYIIIYGEIKKINQGKLKGTQYISVLSKCKCLGCENEC